MHETTLSIPTPDGSMETFLAAPDGPGPFAVVVMYHDVDGPGERMRTLAHRVAAAGYCCAVPDLYYRLGKIVLDPESTAPAVATIRRAAAGSLRNWDTMNDTRALLDILPAEPTIRNGGRAMIGYGAGGRFAVLAAGQFASEVSAAAALFGTGLLTESPDSPHLMLHKVQGELYSAFAERDAMVPLAKVEEFREAVKGRCTAPSLVEILPGTRDDAVARAWEAALRLLGRRLA